jgi:hypothetical protein
MNEKPKFEVVRETPYGPELKRVKDEFTPVEGSDKGGGQCLECKPDDNLHIKSKSDNLTFDSALSPDGLPHEYIEPVGEQREELRNILSDIGIKILPKKKSKRTTDGNGENIDQSRRGFLKVIGAGAVVAAGAAVVGHKILSESDKEESLGRTNPEENVSAAQESVEEVDSLATFDNEIEGYKAFTKLGKNEVIFLDKNNLPVGGPQQLKAKTILREPSSETNPDWIRSDGKVAYKLTPGNTINEIGIPGEGIAREWLDYKQHELQTSYPSQKITRRMNVVLDFNAAYSETDEPELVAAIARGEIDTYDKIISYFAEKPVRDNEEYSRMKYAKEKIMFRSEYDEEKKRPAVPMVIQEEIRRLLPGLFAQESKFNAGLVSKSGATGLAQIKPKTWWEYTRKEEFKSLEEQEKEWERVKNTVNVSVRMDDQVEVASALISDNYHYILHFAGAAIDMLRNQYDSEDKFYVDLMVPLLVNAYNAGGPMMGRILNSFAKEVPSEEMLKGKELFLQIADFAKTKDGKFEDYGIDAREYVSRVYGNSKMLTEKYA